MRLHEIQTIKPKSPEDLQADALKQRADKAADRLKVTKQQKRLPNGFMTQNIQSSVAL